MGIKSGNNVKHSNQTFSKACGDGFYGNQCNNKCGYCRDIDQCSPVNGTCLTGCDAGYQGDRCETRKLKCNQKICKPHKFI